MTETTFNPLGQWVSTMGTWMEMEMEGEWEKQEIFFVAPLGQQDNILTSNNEENYEDIKESTVLLYII